MAVLRRSVFTAKLSVIGSLRDGREDDPTKLLFTKFGESGVSRFAEELAIIFRRNDEI